MRAETLDRARARCAAACASGWAGQTPTRSRTSAALGLTRERIRQTRGGALRKLREAEVSSRLRPYLRD